MNKAALLNVNTGDFDAQEAAREAARRQSKSLGEWLHNVVADDLVDHSTDEQTAGSSERIGAMASRPAHRDESIHDFSEPSMTRPNSMRHAAEVRLGRSASADPELLLARAIDAMDRRTVRSRRRPGEAMESHDRLRERPEVKRERDRVSDLVDRIADIETRLTDRFVVEENPVRATLARLEARLETIGRQSLADAAAFQPGYAHMPTQIPRSDSFRRLEEKLDWILAAVQSWPSESSPIALAASRAAGPRSDRFEGAIGDIGRRQRMLDCLDDEPVSLKEAVLRRGDRAAAAHRRNPFDDIAPIAAMQNEIAELATKIEGLCREGIDRRVPAHEPTIALDSLRTDITTISQNLYDLSQRVDLSNTEISVQSFASRIDDARELGFSATTLQSVKSVVADLCQAFGEIDARKAIEGSTHKIHVICTKIDTLEQAGAERSAITSIYNQVSELSDLISIAAAKPLAAERIESLIASLSELLQTSAQQQGVIHDVCAANEELRDFITYPPGTKAFARIETALDALETDIDTAIAEGKPLAHPVAPRMSEERQGELEGLVRDLSRKMEAVQAPGADQGALDALQKQIAVLAARFESSDDGLAKLNVLQQSMQDVLAHLEETRASVETSAAEAAREVLRIAIEERQAHGDDNTAANLSKMREMQDDAEARTGSALSAVQQTLSKVVDRLSSMESDIAEVRNGREVQATTQVAPAKPSAISLGAPDPLLDQALGAKPVDRSASAPIIPAQKKPVAADTEQDRTDFIAAARRAAKAVQAELSGTELKRPAQPKARAKATNAPRAMLMEQSLDYVARHKRPVLLGLAALFVALGTMAVMQRMGVGKSEVQRAEITPAVQVASAPKQFSTTKPFTTDASKFVKGTPGSDVGKVAVAPLPVFIAPMGTLNQVRPAVPIKLTSMAEAGDGGAEYVLGTQFAEGRNLPRDFKLAARWYQKAADQGVAPAQYRLASLYEKGLGVPQDKAKARSLYLQAAEAGNPRAMHNLAVLLADGDGKPDYSGAATWFRKAAQYGMQDSQFNLAILLARGLGVQQSLVQSYQWFAVAASQDDTDAAKKRDEVGSKMSSTDLAVAKALAASFRPRSVAVIATEVQPPPGGWDGASTSSPLNSARPKVSSL